MFFIHDMVIKQGMGGATRKKVQYTNNPNGSDTTAFFGHTFQLLCTTPGPIISSDRSNTLKPCRGNMETIYLNSDLGAVM